MPLSTARIYAIPAPIIDPFLYVESNGHRVAVLGALDHDRIRQADPGIELRDTQQYGRRELLESGMDWTAVQLEVSRRAVRELGVTSATVNWDFPAGLADLLRADGVELTIDHRAFEARLARISTTCASWGICAPSRTRSAPPWRCASCRSS